METVTTIGLDIAKADSLISARYVRSLNRHGLSRQHLCTTRARSPQFSPRGKAWLRL
jgi:hypothetical protein